MIAQWDGRGWEGSWEGWVGKGWIQTHGSSSRPTGEKRHMTGSSRVARGRTGVGVCAGMPVCNVHCYKE